MLNQLGIVTNIWAKRIEAGDQFEDLAVEFGKNGFRHMEVRDGGYLRNSAFGQLILDIEAAMVLYTDTQWRAICDALWQNGDWNGQIKAAHQSLFDSVGEFVGRASDLVLSYAMSHPWLSPPEDTEADNQRITQAKKLAYLLRPHGARLRLVDLESQGKIHPPVAISNLKRYHILLPDYPMTFAVENARQPADFTLELAVKGRAKLTYDEANTYRPDGTTINEPEAFWSAVKMDHLTSVHLKQRTAEGVLSQIGEGFVDFKAVAYRLKEEGYNGDLLLENTATHTPLEDAIKSREYLVNSTSGCIA